jgi:hypothetical protein
LTLSALREPILETGDGKYTSNLTNVVSENMAVPSGLYVIVVSTFDPQQLATYDLAVYTSNPVEFQKY